VNYSSGVWGLSSITVAQTLPTDDVLWLIARVLLDVAGGLFLLYLLAISGVTTLALVSPYGRPRRMAPATGGRHRKGARPTGGRHRKGARR
jgi:hypothetical protein